MSTRTDSRLFDVRTLERNLRKGLVTLKDYERMIAQLPDAADKATESKPDESRDDVLAARRLAAQQAARIKAVRVAADVDEGDDSLEGPDYGTEVDEDDEDEDEVDGEDDADDEE